MGYYCFKLAFWGIRLFGDVTAWFKIFSNKICSAFRIDAVVHERFCTNEMSCVYLRMMNLHISTPSL